jgi:hypothetical protein
LEFWDANAYVWSNWLPLSSFFVLPDAIILLVASCYCFQFFQIQGSSYGQPDVQLPTPVMERMTVLVVGSHHLLLRLLLALLKVGVEVLVLQRRVVVRCRACLPLVVVAPAGTGETIDRLLWAALWLLRPPNY